MALKFLDCTPRDGGYYNAWDFPAEVILKYLESMRLVGVDIVELGMRSLKNNCFTGASAYTTDDYLRSLKIPNDLTVGVMVNASEIVNDDPPLEVALQLLIPEDSTSSPVQLVRIACHVHEFEKALPASAWLKDRGFMVGYNLMQVADRTQDEIEALAAEAAKWPMDVLYFADSMGSMGPEQTAQIVRWLRKFWTGELGIHTHDNMGMALQNTLRAVDEGVTWLDSTVTGMGRGPGNAKTENLALEISERRGVHCNLVPLMGLIDNYFQPLQNEYGWGTNTYYFLAGKYGIHPTYIQEMLGDSRYSAEDIFATIEYLRAKGGKKFSFDMLDSSRLFYQGTPRGSWCPVDLVKGREVLLIGAGPGVEKHRTALEAYIRKANPLVMALNTQSQIAAELINVRLACHPFRLLADCEAHAHLPQPLITPASMIPENVKAALSGKELLDYGLGVQENTFVTADTYCVLPNSLVIGYALAVATRGQSNRILLAGFDGFGADDPRTAEMQKLLTVYQGCDQTVPLIAVTPTKYSLTSQSIYAM